MVINPALIKALFFHGGTLHGGRLTGYYYVPILRIPFNFMVGPDHPELGH